MALENLFGSEVMTPLANSVPSKHPPVGLLGGRVRTAIDRVVTGAVADIASTYDLARLPSNARILTDQSLIHFDDIGGATTTLDVGLFGVDDSTNDSADVLAADIDIAIAGSGAVGPAIADYGKAIWELLGYASDPGGMFDVRATIAGLATDASGDLVLSMAYAVD